MVEIWSHQFVNKLVEWELFGECFEVSFSVVVARNGWGRRGWVVDGFLVSQETVVLRRSESEI